MGTVQIPTARPNPRISGGTLRWCAGDIFKLYLDIALHDQDSEDIQISTGSTVSVVFRNAREATVKAFTFSAIGNNCITLNFDATATALFPAGAYSYDITYTDADGNKTFLCKDNPCRVE